MTATIPAVVYLLVVRDPKTGELFIPETHLARSSLPDAIAAIDTYDHFPPDRIIGLSMHAGGVAFDASSQAAEMIEADASASEAQQALVDCVNHRHYADLRHRMNCAMIDESIPA